MYTNVSKNATKGEVKERSYKKLSRNEGASKLKRNASLWECRNLIECQANACQVDVCNQPPTIRPVLRPRGAQAAQLAYACLCPDVQGTAMHLMKRFAQTASIHHWYEQVRTLLSLSSSLNDWQLSRVRNLNLYSYHGLLQIWPDFSHPAC